MAIRIRANSNTNHDIQELLKKKYTLFGLSIVFIILLCAYIFRLQVLSNNANNQDVFNQDVIRPDRGQIYIQNYALNTLKLVTSSNYSTKVIINPINLKKQLNKSSIEDLSLALSSVLSSPFNLILENIKEALKKDNQYYVLIQNVSQEQSNSLKNFINEKTYLNSDYVKYDFTNWLSYEDNELRIYPEKELASPVIGYSSNNYWSINDINKEKRCGDILTKNSNFQANGYKIGLSGLEGSSCSELNGINGLRGVKNSEPGNNVILSLDYNLQKEAERINNNIIKDNSNAKGKPKNVASVILEVNNPDPRKNGRVVAMASSPTFDPNNYSVDFENKPSAFLNYVTDVAYESGSVIKPLMVGALLNEYYLNVGSGGNCESNKKLCVSPNWTFNDLCGGKTYTYGSETIRIKNYNGNCFPGNLGLKEVLRDSINTGIADLSKNITSEVMSDYFINKYGFGNITPITTYNEAKGNINTFVDNKGYNINNAFLGFGQSFTNTPIQLAQAYVPFVSSGKMYPIKYLDNNQEAKTSEVILPEVANKIKSYMAATSSEGYNGTGAKLSLDGYGNGTKTGTAQIARSNVINGPDGKPILDENGKEKRTWCDYDCNSEKGLYEHTLVGFAPVNNPRFIIVIKVSEPRPYESANTSANQVLAKPWKELMQYTLEYMQVPKEY